MKKSLLFVSLLLALNACQKAPETDIVNKHIDFSEVHISDSFWSPRLERVAMVTIPV